MGDDAYHSYDGLAHSPTGWVCNGCGTASLNYWCYARGYPRDDDLAFETPAPGYEDVVLANTDWKKGAAVL